MYLMICGMPLQLDTNKDIATQMQLFIVLAKFIQSSVHNVVKVV